MILFPGIVSNIDIVDDDYIEFDINLVCEE